MNLYWPVYKNLEAELLNLSKDIHFDDRQDTVYSAHIADLLVRTAVEIEALSKHLYKLNGGNMNPINDQGDPRSLFFDSDCIQMLDKKWGITKKIVNVVSPNFFFTKEENKVLRPLKDCNKQGYGRWKKAYQSVKHERVEKLAAGNVGNLVRAMAALYLLNIYNFDDRVAELGAGETDIDSRLGSEVFNVNIYGATMLSLRDYLDDSCIDDNINVQKGVTLQSSVLIDRYTDESIRQMFKAHMDDLAITTERAERSAPLQNFLNRHPEYSDKSLNEICIACGEEMERNLMKLGGREITEDEEKKISEAGRRFLVSIFSFTNMTNGTPAKRELILNKATQIYPVL